MFKTQDVGFCIVGGYTPRSTSERPI